MARLVTAIIATFLLSMGPGATGRADTPAETDQTGLLQGMKPALVYNGAVFSNLGGGIRSQGTYTGNLNLQLTVDGASLFGWKDTLFYFDGLWIHGGQPSNFTGDVQGNAINCVYTGTVDSKDAMKGKVDLVGLGTGTFTAKRQ